jgi:hypothetical protein
MLPVIQHYLHVCLRKDLQEEEFRIGGGEGEGIDPFERRNGNPARDLAPRMSPEAVGDPEDEVVPDGSGGDRVLVRIPPPSLRDRKEAGRQKNTPGSAWSSSPDVARGR